MSQITATSGQNWTPGFLFQSWKNLSINFSIACRCRELAKAGHYKYFAIGFHGECVSSENVAELDKMFEARKEVTNGCINGNWGTCDKGHEAECTGTEDFDFFYQVS